MERIRIGIIGAGMIFPEHAKALQAIPEVEIGVVCDIDVEQARRRAEEFGIPRITDDWREVVAGDVDAVFVLTPPMVHREPTVAALAAGKHVFCEKPLAHTLADGRAIVEAARASEAICQIGFNYLFDPATRQMWQMHRRGEFGRIVRAYDRHMVFRTTASWTNRRDAWRLDQAVSGGRMQEFGSHKVHWLLALGGRARSVVGRNDVVASTLAEVGVDDTIVMLMDFVEGGVGIVETSLAPTVRNDRVAGIQGTEGSVEWTGGDVLLVRRKDVDTTEEVPVQPSPETRQAHFIRWIRQRDRLEEPPTPEVTPEAAYHVLEVCLAFLESARDGKVHLLEST